MSLLQPQGAHRGGARAASRRRAAACSGPEAWRFAYLQVGLGNRGTHVGPHHRGTSRRSLRGDCRSGPGANRRLSRLRSGAVPAFADLDIGILERVAADAVLLVTPPEGHLDQARARLRGGPAAARREAAGARPRRSPRDRANSPRTAVCPLTVGLNFRYLPVSREIRRLVAKRDARRARLRNVQLPSQPRLVAPRDEQVSADHAPPDDARAEHSSPRSHPVLLRAGGRGRRRAEPGIRHGASMPTTPMCPAS